MNTPLPPAHPVPQLSDCLFSFERASSRTLLLGDPRLSLSFNARGALHEVGHELLAADGRRDEVLLPAFHCPSGVTPLLEAGLRPVFYRIRPDLSVDLDDLLSKTGPRTRALLVIHFFGLATDLRALVPLRERGIALIEDWSHSFLQLDAQGQARLPELLGDYQVFSFWKLVPSGVGGGLRRREPSQPWTRALPPWRERLVRFKREWEEALEHSPHQRSHQVFQGLEAWRTGKSAMVPAAAALADTPLPQAPSRGEDLYPFDRQLARCAMPPGAKRRLLSADFSALAAQRREHHARYAAGLPEHADLLPLQPDIGASACPWVYPVRLRQRDRIDRQWRAAGVALHTFGIWLHSGLKEADALTRADAELLASELLCLSVHQGLERSHIERGIEVIGKHFKTKGSA